MLIDHMCSGVLQQDIKGPLTILNSFIFIVLFLSLSLLRVFILWVFRLTVLFLIYHYWLFGGAVHFVLLLLSENYKTLNYCFFKNTFSAHI